MNFVQPADAGAGPGTRHVPLIVPGNSVSAPEYAARAPLSRCVRRDRGFTLLEVLIALVVLALAMGSIIKAASEYTGNQSHMRDRTLAMWVARDVLVQFQVEGEWPRVGESKGTLEMGRQEWRWLARTSQTEEPRLRRLDVEVMPEDSDRDKPLAVLSGFLRQPGT